ncbi:hypothetical protein IG631_02120 [Alternaria alternata]|nr:hypothetical protein IG631_02120 [Alternaria alternata]
MLSVRSSVDSIYSRLSGEKPLPKPAYHCNMNPQEQSLWAIIDVKWCRAGGRLAVGPAPLAVARFCPLVSSATAAAQPSPRAVTSLSIFSANTPKANRHLIKS